MLGRLVREKPVPRRTIPWVAGLQDSRHNFHLDPAPVMVPIKGTYGRGDDSSTSPFYHYNCCFTIQSMKKLSEKTNTRHCNKGQEMYLCMQMRE